MSRDWNAINNAISDDVLDRDLLEDLLGDLGCDNVKVYKGGRSYRGTCPVHGGDDPNLDVVTDGYSLPIRWTCYSHQCQKKWMHSLLGLVRGVLSSQKGRDVHPQVAVDYLMKFLGGTLTTRPPTVRSRPKPQAKVLKFTRAQVRARLVLPSPYFVSRGFSPAVLDSLDVGHSPKERKSIVPLHSDDGETCIGYMARSEMPTCGECGKSHAPDRPCRYGRPRWTIMEGFPKASYLYNYHAALRSDARVVIVTEGPADVWRAQEAGYLAVALLGLDLSAEQVQKLVALKKSVRLAFDNDKAGQKALFQAHERLLGKVIVRPLFVPPQYKDLGDVPTVKVVRWLSAKITAP